MISKNKERLIITSWKPIIESVKAINSLTKINKSDIVTLAIYIWLNFYEKEIREKKYNVIKEECEKMLNDINNFYIKHYNEE